MSECAARATQQWPDWWHASRPTAASNRCTPWRPIHSWHLGLNSKWCKGKHPLDGCVGQEQSSRTPQRKTHLRQLLLYCTDRSFRINYMINSELRNSRKKYPSQPVIVYCMDGSFGISQIINFNRSTCLASVQLQLFQNCMIGTPQTRLTPSWW